MKTVTQIRFRVAVKAAHNVFVGAKRELERIRANVRVAVVKNRVRRADFRFDNAPGAAKNEFVAGIPLASGAVNDVFSRRHTILRKSVQNLKNEPSGGNASEKTLENIHFASEKQGQNGIIEKFLT